MYEFGENLKVTNILPLAGKIPEEKEWQKFCVEPRPEPIKINGHNVGIPCGPLNGVLLLDIDDSEKFAKNNYEIPDTFTVKTGRGEYHHYFKYPSDGADYRNRSFKPMGFDIRGNGGQVVAPSDGYLK